MRDGPSVTRQTEKDQHRSTSPPISLEQRKCTRTWPTQPVSASSRGFFDCSNQTLPDPGESGTGGDGARRKEPCYKRTSRVVAKGVKRMATPSGSYDVVILGSGIAGLAGALAAHELGLKPVVLEKAAALGGGTVHSYGLIWVGQNYLARDVEIADSRDEILAYLRFLGGGAVDEARLAAFVTRSPEVLQFYAACGIRLRMVRGVTDHYYDKAPGSHAEGRTVEVELISGDELGEWRDRVLVPHDVPCFVTAEEQIAWGGINRASHWDAGLVTERRRRDMRGKGLGLVCRFVAALSQRGVPMLSGQRAARLAVDNGRVVGVATASGEFIEARRGVILATGGYGADPLMSGEFEQLPGFEHDDSGLIPSSLTGDGLVLGAEIGGIVHKVENSLRVMLSYTIPPETPGGMATS